MQHDKLATIYGVHVSNGGVPKLPIESAHVGPLGLEGDSHNDTKHHGGPDRAVCLYSFEVIEQLRSEGHPAYPGSTGENLTVQGLDWRRLTPGARLRIGDELLLEVTQYTTPCFNIKGSFSDGRFGRISHKTHPGESRVYARVLQPGTVRAGDEVELIAPKPTQSVPTASVAG